MEIKHWLPESQDQLCRDILNGLGFNSASHFKALGLSRAFYVPLVRKSSDELFCTDENWQCVFEFPNQPLGDDFANSLIQGAIIAEVQCLLLVVFGIISSNLENDIRAQLSQEQIHTVIFSGDLAMLLAKDYGTDDRLKLIDFPTQFSFALLRQEIKAQVDEFPWHNYFQTASIQPARLVPLQDDEKQDKSLTEADLFRAMRQGSLLLLGEPGVGKTTTLLALGKQLAETGGLMPLFLPLGRYQGDFKALLAEALGAGTNLISQKLVRQLLESGGLVLLLDGVNEVQELNLQEKLIQELNQLTAPNVSTRKGLWIVTGRVLDYEHSRFPLVTLERRRWEMQPFTADLVYQLLSDALGKEQGLALYQQMGKAVREVCARPLLLTMLLGVYQSIGHAPVGRTALYKQFIELLLQWGQDRHLGQELRQKLQEQLREPLTQERYKVLVEKALTKVATAMSTTQIPWVEAHRLVTKSLSQVVANPQRAAELLLEDVSQRGLLRRDTFNRLRFYHHTFQEYFTALAQSQQSIELLLPKRNMPAAQRETVLFIAGLIPDPTPLLQQMLSADDVETAYEIFRDSPKIISKKFQDQLAKQLWQQIHYGDRIGHNRRKAQMFQTFAQHLGQTEEELSSQIDRELSKNDQISRLLSYYRELGDLKSERRIFAQSIQSEQIPEDFLFDAALIASNSGDDLSAIKIYTQYLKIFYDQLNFKPSLIDSFISKFGYFKLNFQKKQDIPNISLSGAAAAYNNRGACYESLNRNKEAISDYQRAIDLVETINNVSYGRLKLAQLLWKMNRKDEAKDHINLFLQRNPTNASAHSSLADWIEEEDPETALQHRNTAVRYAPHDDALKIYLRKLVALQEKQGQSAAAIRSLRQLIELDPTSIFVRSWKQCIAQHRQTLDAENRTRSARQRLREQGELPLPVLVGEWLKASGLEIRKVNSVWIVTQQGTATSIPVALLTAPIITAQNLREVVTLCTRTVANAKQVLIVIVAQTLSFESQQLSVTLKDSCQIALVTAIEVQDSLLQSDRECRALFDRSLQRAKQVHNPFLYKGIVLEQTEFFGRVVELEQLTQQIGRGQSIGLYGIHKIGKSSLLAQLSRRLRIGYPELTIIQVEINVSCKTAQDFYRLILEQLPGQSDIEISHNLSAQVFYQKLVQFHEHREKYLRGHRLMLVLDEYAYLIPDRKGKGGIQDFLEVLSILKAMVQENWLLLLPCGRTATLSRQANWGNAENPFIDLLQVYFLNPMRAQENDALMKILGQKADLYFQSDALDAIYEETAGHPSFSRNLGSMLIMGGKGVITIDKVQEAVARLLKDRDQKNILLAIYEERLDKDEQDIARKVAINPCIRQDLYPKKANVIVRRQIRDALDNLIDTTVLVEREDGKIAHRYGLLERVIRQEVEELGF